MGRVSLQALTRIRVSLPYEEEDARFFFGRETECRVIAANLRAAQLTLLYGESGVGKSSILRAGVVPVLKEDPDFTVVVCRSWRDDPIRLLSEGVWEAHRPASRPCRQWECRICRVAPVLYLMRSSKSCQGLYLVIFDQFEEYFQYHPSDGSKDSLGQVISRPPTLR